MKSCKLSFGTINILRDNLAEIVVDEGVVMDEFLVDELHDFLQSSTKPPRLVLVNKKHSYSYTFKAQITIMRLTEIKAIAVTHNSSGALMSTETLMSVNQDLRSKVKMFRSREEALSWLDSLEFSKTL